MKLIALFLSLIVLNFPAFAQEEAAPATPDTTPPKMRSYMGTTQPKKTETVKERQPNVEIWLPPEFQSSEQKWPLLIFSHGFGGCAKQSTFLTKYLADHGYIVIAPDHTDSRCDRQMGQRLMSPRAGKTDWPERPFRTPEAWTDETEADRRDDVLFALSSMLDDRQYKDYIDLDKIGLLGHSLGGYTVLGLAGARTSWKDKRFKAVLAMSPFVTPYLLNGGLKRLDVPVLYEGGTKDKQMTPDLKKRGGAYAQTKSIKYFAELDGADHFSWTEMDKDYQTIIEKLALQFFDKHLKGGAGDILPEGADKPGVRVNKVKTFWKDEGAAAQVKAPAK